MTRAAHNRRRTITTPWGETYRGTVTGTGTVWSGGVSRKTVKIAAEDGKTRYALAAWLNRRTG